MQTPQMLATIEVCADLDAATLDELSHHGRCMHAHAGQFLVAAGEREAPIHMIAGGSIRLTVPNIAGAEKTIATLDAGKSFGLAEYASGRVYRYYALAQTASDIVTVPGRVLFTLAERDPQLMRNLLASLGRQFDALAHDIENSSRYNAPQRVINLLLRTATRRSGGTVAADLPQRKAVTASRLGLAPETFSRALATLADQGLISVHNRTITLHDPQALQARLDEAND